MKQNSTSVEVTKHADLVLMTVTILLVMVGIVMVYSSSAILAEDHYGDSYYFLVRQMIYAVIGIVMMFVVRMIPYKIYWRLTYPLYLISFLLLVIVFVPGLNVTTKGASRWIDLGFFNLQPSEVAKLSLLIFLAYVFAKKGANIRSLGKGLLPILGLATLMMALILLQPDFGSTVIMGSVLFLLLVVAGARFAHLGGMVLLAVPLLYQVLFAVDFRRARMLAFLNPWEHQLDSGFQIIQSFVAFQSGGLAGVGLGEGKQKLFYLPEAHTDFIFSVLGEELGFLGVSGVIFLFVILVWRGFRTALNARDMFGMYLALGITSLLGLEMTVNLCVVMGLLPTKGLALPFISYGGTSLIVSLVMVGILLNIGSVRVTMPVEREGR